MQKKGLIITLSSIAVLIIAVFSAIIIIEMQKGEKGEKDITVTVVYANESQEGFKINTNAEFLADALLEHKLIKEDEYKSGFYSYINGVRADYSLDGGWWGVYVDDVLSNYGMNDIAISDGDKFEIKYTPA